MHTPLKKWLGRLAAVSLVMLPMTSTVPAWAADPFRTGKEARSIGPTLQSAFEDFFRHGDYQNAGQKLTKAQLQNPDEPLVYALQAALAYQNGRVDQIVAFAQKTRQTAEALDTKDPCRSHLYRGLAQGLEGSSFFLKDGILGLPKAMTYVPSMFLEFNKALELNPNDPETNLFVGYINVLLTKHEAALQEFGKSAPPYLALRGQALALRDKKAYPEAYATAEQALAGAPRNPDLHYLKGQILALLDKPAEAVESFDRALSLGAQLPEGTRKQLLHERKVQFERLTASK